VSKQVEEAGDIFLRLVNEGKKPSLTIQRLIDALGLGSLTQREVGNDFPVLKREAERQLAELRSQPSMTDEEIDRAKRLEMALMGAWEKHTKADRMVLYERQDAREFDHAFTSTDKFGKDYDWSQSYESGAKSLGAGSFGSVMVSKPPPALVVKRGEVSESEVRILEKLNGKDISPRLVSAEIDKLHRGSREGDIDFYPGRVAMTRVPGKAVEDFNEYDPAYGTKVGNTTLGDAYFFLRKKLHESGVAHNDAHIQNVIVDDKGKARFIDFGLSQDDPRAALSEAMGILADRRLLPQGVLLKRPLDEHSGDRQGRKFKPYTLPMNELLKGGTGTNLEKIVRNRTKVYAELAKLGLSKDEIAELVVHELNQPISSYNKGAWSKVSKEDAMRIIPLLYEGVN
jgi:predicted Ser/Thr protein kinase